MNAKLLFVYATLALGVQQAAAQQATSRASSAGGCVELFHAGVSQLDNGSLREAEITLRNALASATGGDEQGCAGWALGKLALVATLCGRPVEAETFAERAIRLWRWAAILGAAMWIAGEWLGIDEAANIGLAMAYGTGLLLWSPRARWLAAAGRMALANYLLQSVIFGFIFYSYGLGWFGRVAVVATLLGGLVVYGLQLVFSEWWLRRFRFGPVEWLWRCVSYLRWQPFLRVDDLTVSRSAVRVLAVMVCGVVIPLVHLGIPMLLARAGPRWGWSGGRPAPVNLCGTLAILLGLCLLTWIGKTALHESQKLPSRVRLGLRPTHLVQTGPYAWLRHPIYAAECCLWIGIIVLFGSPLAAVSFLCLFASVARWIVRREERALEEQFGEEYRSYRGRVRSSVLPLFNR